MSSAGFEPTIPAIERLQAYVLGPKATGIGDMNFALFPVYVAGRTADVPPELESEVLVTAVRRQSEFGWKRRLPCVVSSLTDTHRNLSQQTVVFGMSWPN